MTKTNILFEHVKVYTSILRETKDAYHLRFCLKHKHNDDKAIPFASNLLDESWNLWIPKNMCRRITDEYFLIDNGLFTKLICSSTKGNDFRKVRMYFCISGFPKSVDLVYKTILNRETNTTGDRIPDWFSYGFF